MRCLLPALLLTSLTACAGNVADYVGPRSTIVSPQLIRYGFDVTQSRCIGRQLGASLSPLQLRRFQRLAAAVRQGWSEPGRLTPRDLRHVAESMRDPDVKTALDVAMQACGVSLQAPVQPDAPEEPPPAAPRPPTWLNLGAAPTGQSIAVDASSLEEEGAARTAWFRLTNPGEATPLGTAYRLRIDCRARTIAQLGLRHDGNAAPASTPDAAANTVVAMPVEGGTVMEIAYLAMCT